ncbi:MAG TPA: rubrerythrin family protein [Dehalococcoidia bacterium]|nr:rubrerythrin family protein [Dehalococcoidia bacterium]
MSTTSKNTEAAFAGESQANRRYLFFAQKADEDGLKQVARLFRAAADAETVHARNHFRVLGGVKTTEENLGAAIGGEHYEFTKMYPEFIKQSEADGDKAAKDSFDLANRVEQIHHKLFGVALQGVEKGVKAAEKNIFVCQHCGNTVEGEAPDKCPVCGRPKKMFKQVD